RLPRDAQDKGPHAALAALFEGRAAPRPAAPKLVGERRDPGHLVRELEVPEDLAALEGHFEGFPLVAGVVQLGWVFDAAAEWLGGAPPLARVEALEFPQPPRPPRRLTLQLRRPPGEPRPRLLLPPQARR